MKKILFYLLVFPLAIFAQVNKSDTLNIKAGLSLTGFFQGGNVQTLIFRAQSDLSFKASKDLVFKTQNSYVYQEFGKVKADEDILSLNFLTLNPDKKIHPLILGFISTNFRREIDLRYLFGGGFTYKVIDNKKISLTTTLTSEYERTNFNQTDFIQDEYDGSETINTVRATLWVSGKYRLFKNKVILTHQSYIQPSLQESNNYRWQADIGMEFPIWKFLNFKVNYLHTFESVVVQNQKQQDKFLTFGFTLKNY